MKFTDKYIQSLKPKKARYDIREGQGNGLAIRCSTSGQKTWVYFYHFEGKKRRMTLGNYPAMSLSEARKRHRAAMTALSHGKDPGSERIQNKIEAKGAPTVNLLIKEYIEKYAKAPKSKTDNTPRKKSWKEDERLLLKDIAPNIGRRKAKDIKKRDIILILDHISERGAPIAANRTLAVTRRMFNFAVERDIVESSPCHLVKAPSKENQKDKFLSEEEIRCFWQNLEKANMSELIKIALKLQLTTAQRKGEVITAEWKDVDLQRSIWEIPANKTKNGKAHIVPLSDLAISLFHEAKTQNNNSIWAFPSPTCKKHIIPTAVDRALRRNKDLFKEIEDLYPHNLRRTAASHMTQLGIPRLVVSKILNHVERGVTAIYDRHEYFNEKRSALNKWQDKLKQILANTSHLNNVISI